jgi:hypothetical protein
LQREDFLQVPAQTREERWEALYDRLFDDLAEVGKNDACGDGDYWIVDDDWGGLEQKICVTQPGFWTDAIQARVRRILDEDFRDWGVFVVFEDGSRRRGLIIYFDHLEFEPGVPPPT